MHAGDIAFAIGNPLGLRLSVTQGIVSSASRSVSEGNGVTLSHAIQTSAEINPGNSGGALVDLSGRVIGLPTLAALDPEFGGAQAPGIGFAIPSSTVRRVADELIGQGRIVAGTRADLHRGAGDADRQHRPDASCVELVLEHPRLEWVRLARHEHPTATEVPERHFDLLAEADLKGYRVTVGFTGTTDRFYPTFSSDPALPQSQIISLVLTGDLGAVDQTGGTRQLAQTGVGLAGSLIGEAISRSVDGVAVAVMPRMAGEPSASSARRMNR